MDSVEVVIGPPVPWLRNRQKFFQAVSQALVATAATAGARRPAACRSATAAK